MEIKINKKDIRKSTIYVIEQDHKIKLKTNNINKIRAWEKTMKYVKINDYTIYRIGVEKIHDRYNNIY